MWFFVCVCVYCDSFTQNYQLQENNFTQLFHCEIDTDVVSFFVFRSQHFVVAWNRRQLLQKCSKCAAEMHLSTAKSTGISTREKLLLWIVFRCNSAVDDDNSDLITSTSTDVCCERITTAQRNAKQVADFEVSNKYLSRRTLMKWSQKPHTHTDDGSVFMAFDLWLWNLISGNCLSYIWNEIDENESPHTKTNYTFFDRTKQ